MARFGGVYYGKNYTAWIKDVESFLKAGDTHFDSPLLVVVEHVVQKARTSKLLFPRGDVDNFDKGPLDAITKATGHWSDDNIIVQLLGIKRFAEPDEAPHTKIEIYLLPQ